MIAGPDANLKFQGKITFITLIL